MFGSAARLFAAVVLAAGLVCLAPHAAEGQTRSKKQAAAKKAAAKGTKGKKESSKRNDPASKRSKGREGAKTARGSKRKPDARASNSSAKRGKNEGRTASRDERPRRATAAPAPKRVVAASFDEDDAEEAEPAGPSPANRLVADIPNARVVEIQNALIKEGLMTGPPTGVYDQATFSAMSAFQVRKGFKPVGVPTASSLRELGVRKSSGTGVTTAARALETTAP